MAQQYLRHIIAQIRILTNTLNAAEYTLPLPLLHNATVGKHTRHIIEAFGTIAQGLEADEISFDRRERDLRLETDSHYAMEYIENLARQITQSDLSRQVLLINDFSYQENEVHATTPTNLERELIYAIEHAIHHLAIIRIGVEQVFAHSLPDDFGVAPSTVRHKMRVGK